MSTEKLTHGLYQFYMDLNHYTASPFPIYELLCIFDCSVFTVQINCALSERLQSWWVSVFLLERRSFVSKNINKCSMV